MDESRKIEMATAKMNAHTGSEPRTTQLVTDGDALENTASLSPEKFNPGWLFYTAFISLCIITLAVALDATSLSVALPVNTPPC